MRKTMFLFLLLSFVAAAQTINGVTMFGTLATGLQVNNQSNMSTDSNQQRILHVLRLLNQFDMSIGAGRKVGPF